MLKTIIRVSTIGLALLASVVVTAPDITTSAEASSNVSAQRSRQCSADARRYADRNTRRTTATGAAGGAAIGAIIRFHTIQHARHLCARAHTQQACVPKASLF